MRASADRLAPLRAKLGLPASAPAAEVIAAAVQRIPAPVAAPVAAAPAPVAPAPPAAPSGPSEDLVEEARWEEVNAALFGIRPGPGSATERLAAMGAPTPEEARSDAYAAAQRAQAETFARNAEADRLAQVREVDAARGANARVSAEDRRAREDRVDALLFPELRRP